MNYRHAFHAGNFADLVKHAALLQVLAKRVAAPLTIIDTHAGRGLYDLAGVEALKSGEAAAGIARLMAANAPPAAFGGLIRAVQALNPSSALRRYPGSPWLIQKALRPGDAYIACELRPDEHGALSALMKADHAVTTLCADGYTTAAERTPGAGEILVLIDPPFERADDYGRIVETLAVVRQRNPRAQALVWLPLKDLETFDSFLRELEDAMEAPILVAETRMRPLTDPMKMNGCALVLVGAPEGLSGDLEAICTWTANTLGEAGRGRVYGL